MVQIQVRQSLHQFFMTFDPFRHPQRVVNPDEHRCSAACEALHHFTNTSMLAL